MKIINLIAKSKMYTANVFFVHGSWNAIDDVNTLVDVGRDPAVIESINEVSSGVGKKRVDQVILTHSHYDHSSLLPVIRNIFDPVVYAFSSYIKGIDHILEDGDKIKIGDEMFEVLCTPAHSSDSICLYCEKEGILFAGDTPVLIRSPDGTSGHNFIQNLEKLCSGNICKIYFGHGDTITEGCRELIYESLRNIRKSGLKKKVLACP